MNNLIAPKFFLLLGALILLPPILLDTLIILKNNRGRDIEGGLALTICPILCERYVNLIG